MRQTANGILIKTSPAYDIKEKYQQKHHISRSTKPGG